MDKMARVCLTKMGDYWDIGKGAHQVFNCGCGIILVGLVFVVGFIVGGFLVIFKFNDQASLIGFVWFVEGVCLSAVVIGVLFLLYMCLNGPERPSCCV